MCGRFGLWSVGKLKQRFEASGDAGEFGGSYNVAPGVITPVVVRRSPNSIVMMKWGLVPSWAKDPKIGYRMINARAEGIEGKPAFRRPIRSQRCVVPADGFYEWKQLKLEKRVEKVPWFLGLRTRETMGLAGVYDEWEDAEGKKLLSYAIITCPANELLVKIHERMPVILRKKDEDRWLEGTTSLEKILDLLRPFPAGEMTGYPVSRRVNNPGEDNEGLVERLKRGRVRGKLREG
jgi:putative SOS response-associated peptidase YedK